MNQALIKQSFASFMLLAIFSLPSYAQVPEFNWVKRLNGNLNDYSNSIISDHQGNLYLAGSFASYVIDIGDTTLVNHAAATKDMFITKMDNQGNPIWARSAGNTEDDEALCMTTDQEGNIYVAGYFSKSVSFDGITLTTSDSYNEDIFLLKYRSDGHIIWAKSLSSDFHDRPASITTDACGNILLTGHFLGYRLHMDTIVLNSNGNTAMFLCKINPEGKVLWGLGSSSSYYSYGKAITTDQDCNFYLGGSFSGYSFILDTVTLTTAGESDFFVAKFTSAGTLQWIRKYGGTGGETIRQMVVDNNGNIYFSGYFVSPTLQIGNTVLTNNTLYDGNLLLVKLDQVGVPLWATSAQGASVDLVTGLTLDELGCPYLCGYYDSFTLAFDTTVLSNSNLGYNDIFLAKYNPDGKLSWVCNAGGNYDDYCMGMTIDTSGKLFLTGYFYSDNILFGTQSLPSTAGNLADIFVAQMDKVVGVDELCIAKHGLVYPNPSQGTFSLLLPKKAEILNIYNQQGQIIKTWYNADTTTFVITLQVPGLYFLEAIGGQEKFSCKVLID